MELINNEIEQVSKTGSKDQAISKGEKFRKTIDEKTVSDEEKAFYASVENIHKTFISRNRIY